MPASPSPVRRTRPRREPAADAVLTKAVLRAGGLLALTNAVLARTLGVSEAGVSRLSTGLRTIDPSSKEGELALLLIRAYRSLDALVGSDEAARRAWMTSHNRFLNGKPVALIERAEGLAAVVVYLDAMRAPA
ncbi:MAG: DUF2384 domain-containing protein [Betaproteobacteria bacterium]|nr:DUF2384 domain-containing protein [Betaproteobacteria bacterium]